MVTQLPAQWPISMQPTIMSVPNQWPPVAVGSRYQQVPLLPQQGQGLQPQAPHIPQQGPPTTPTPLLPPPAPVISLTQRDEVSTHLPLAEKEKRMKAWINNAKEVKKERKINRDDYFDSDTE